MLYEFMPNHQFLLDLGVKESNALVFRSRKVSFILVSKICNMSALSLVILGLRTDGEKMWMELFSSHVYSIVVYDF